MHKYRVVYFSNVVACFIPLSLNQSFLTMNLHSVGVKLPGALPVPRWLNPRYPRWLNPRYPRWLNPRWLNPRQKLRDPSLAGCRRAGRCNNHKLFGVGVVGGSRLSPQCHCWNCRTGDQGSFFPQSAMKGCIFHTDRVGSSVFCVSVGRTLRAQRQPNLEWRAAAARTPMEGSPTEFKVHMVTFKHWQDPPVCFEFAQMSFELTGQVIWSICGML